MHKLLFIILIIFINSAKADVAILVHGYLGDASSWEKSSVNTILRLNGWQQQGILVSTPQGVINRMTPKASTDQNKPSKHSFYTVVLPYKEPLEIQAGMLQNMINAVAIQHPDETMTLVGHSAGGVVARLALVQYGKGQVSRLITIASPHQGTPRAAQALKAADSSGMFGFVKKIFGGADYQLVKSSTRLLMQLLPAKPGTYLDGLNNAPHPDIQYVAIIRNDPEGRLGDPIVPGYSQNMNNVPALAGRVFIHPTTSVHTLVPQDGILLAIMLSDTE